MPGDENDGMVLACKEKDERESSEDSESCDGNVKGEQNGGDCEALLVKKEEKKDADCVVKKETIVVKEGKDSDDKVKKEAIVVKEGKDGDCVVKKEVICVKDGDEFLELDGKCAVHILFYHLL